MACCCAYSQGQNNGATVRVFHPGQQNAPVETQAHKDSMRIVDKNALKWNWSLLTRGVFLINYERYIGGNFTIEIGAGLTYRDFLFEFTKSVGGDTIEQFQNSNSTSAFGSASPKMCGEAGLKYYPGGYDNMSGVYLEADVSYRTYVFPSPEYQPVIAGSGYVPGYNFLDEQFKFGYISSSWFSDVTGEFYIGLGLRNATVNTYEDIDYSTYTSTVHAYKPITFHLTYPQALLGFKLDYTF